MPDHVNTREVPEPPEWAEAIPMEAMPDRITQVKRRVLEPPEAPKSDIQQFRERCEAAGIADDKPLYQVMMTLFVASETALATVKSGARGLTQEGESDLIKRISRTADASMRDAAAKHRLRLERKTALIAGGVAVVCLVLGGSGGFWFGWSSGRQSVETTERQIAAAFQSGPDAAGVWLRLMRNNDPRRALDQCSGSAVWSDSGRQACSIPLWIDGPGVPQASNR